MKFLKGRREINSLAEHLIEAGVAHWMGDGQSRSKFNCKRAGKFA